MANDLTFETATSASDHVGTVLITKIEHSRWFKAFAYQCSMEEDLDGAPRGYGLNNPTPVNPAFNPDTSLQRGIVMLETSLANGADPAGEFTALSRDFSDPTKKAKATDHVFRWVGIQSMTQTDARAAGVSIDKRPFLEARASDRSDKSPRDLIVIPSGEEGMFPVIQGNTSPAPGFYVSTTSGHTNDRLNDWNQNKYVNAVLIPYAAHAGWWKSLGVKLGDMGLAINPLTGAFSAFVFGDTGTGRVGEVSRNLLTALSPSRDNEISCVFLVFPGSGTDVADKYTDVQVIQTQVERQLSYLALAPNINELVLFLALGANLVRFNLLKTTGRIDDRVRTAAVLGYQNIRGALAKAGLSFQSAGPQAGPRSRGPQPVPAR